MSSFQSNSYLFGNNASFIEALYNQYLKSPAGVDKSWQEYFAQLQENKEQLAKTLQVAEYKAKCAQSLSKSPEYWAEEAFGVDSQADKTVSKAGPASTLDDIKQAVAINNLIDAYRTYGHLAVALDPLKLVRPEYQAVLDPARYGLSEDKADNKVMLNGAFGVNEAAIKDIISALQATYASRVGYEFMHMDNQEAISWFLSRLEKDQGVSPLSMGLKVQVLKDLIETTAFEEYVHTKFPGLKRFSVEGGEASIASIEHILRKSAEAGAEEVIIGMAHRGRLNTLTKIMKKPYSALFSECRGNLAFPETLNVPGDVKYHLGASVEREVGGKSLHVSLAHNPSHLEAVNTVVLGKVRAKQDQKGDAEHQKIFGILVHGDAAVAGQGSVSETLSLSQLGAYRVGGTIHIVPNNQIGFTTMPVSAKSSRYCTDIAKSIGAPVLHVNGDDIEAVIYATELALEYKMKFKADIFVDIVCYRKYGHNEGDEPFFTQPVMYNAIAEHKTPPVLYAEQLVVEGAVQQSHVEELAGNFKVFLDTEFELSKTYKPEKADWLEGDWSVCVPSNSEQASVNSTGVNIEKLRGLGERLYHIPENFNLNTKIVRQLQAKANMIERGEGIDWGTGEALAFATLLAEGTEIRMTGQDVERGTFSHRHAVLVDQQNEARYISLNNLLAEQKARIEIYNSNLSEFGVLGFEYGYSVASPQKLVIWEAQFGDFANGAQVIIDQFIASAEAKWLRMSGIVLLLPHGYEGQGPEHSSARLERFLQLCADDNMQVANCTTPASLFHILRRQLHRNYRKPLILMTPKSLLRHKLAISTLSEMAEGTAFQPILAEVEPNKSLLDLVEKVILCSGKVYYDLYEKRAELSRNNVAIIRLEQLYPFPYSELEKQLVKYSKAKVVWCQEEPRNMGAYFFVKSFIEGVLMKINHANKTVQYAGRPDSAAPAVGYMKLHLKELDALLKVAFE